MAKSASGGPDGAEGLPQHPRVERLKPDPSQPAKSIVYLVGLPGNSDRPGYQRLYLTTRLDYYAEFLISDMVHSEAVPADQSPIAGHEATRVSINRDATIHYIWAHRAGPIDEFDLDIRLGPAGAARITPGLPTRVATCFVEGTACGTCDGTCDDTCPHTCQTCHGTCRTCAGQATCQTCQTLCGQATCHTCPGQATCQTCQTQCGQATCQTCPGQATCQTCPGQATCAGRTCVFTQCNQNTCQTCFTQCNQATCNTCRTQCGQPTCDDTCHHTCITCVPPPHCHPPV